MHIFEDVAHPAEVHGEHVILALIGGKPAFKGLKESHELCLRDTTRSEQEPGVTFPIHGNSGLSLRGSEA